MAGGGNRIALAALLLALGAGGVGASASNAPGQAWKADPEEQFLLDVTIRQLRLGEGVRAYPTPQGTCVVFGDFIKTLDVPVETDLARKRAAGWAFKENNRLVIDAAAGSASFGAGSEAIAAGTIRESPEGWCVDTAALSRWFGIKVTPMTGGSALVLESEAKLPVELARERQLRAQRIKPASFDIASLPRVKLPYRMWRAPALDVVVSGGVTYNAHSGARVDRRTSLYAAGEIARLSYDAQLGTDQKGRPNTLRLRAYRSDPDGGLLGPLQATHFAMGDVAGFDSSLTGAPANGRGALVTNRPLFTQTAFDRSRFEGDLPPGWEAEIYRNGELLGFAKASADQRYAFEDIQLLYGENRISIMLYGPHGQVRTREELINVGEESVPPGKTWYWAGFNQPGRDMVSMTEREAAPRQPEAQAAVSVEHGVDRRTSVGVLARAMLIEDERLTFVEGSARRAVGRALVEVAAGRDSSGGTALRAKALGKLGAVHLNAEGLIANDFHVRGQRPESMKDVRIAAYAPVKIGRTTFPAHASMRFTDRADGTSEVEAAARLSVQLERFNLGADVTHRRQMLQSGPAPPSETTVSLLGSGSIGDVRVRGSSSFDLSPVARFRSAELSAHWSASDRTDWEAGLGYDAAGGRARGRVTHVKRFDSMALALTGEAATDGSVAFGFNLSFSLDVNSGIRMSRQPLAGAGAVHARVYRDLNDNGVREPSEPFEKGALVTTGRRASDRPTDERGAVLVGGLATYTPVTVGIDQTSLSDPMLVPRQEMQVVVPRPGVPALVEIALVGGGDVEGALVRSGGVNIEGADLELVDAAGRTVARTRSDFDGFFLFERVAYGRYALRLAKESADALGVIQMLGAEVLVSQDTPVVRLGTIAVQPLQRIAALE